MLSSSRRLVARLDAFEVGTSCASGNATFEPVSLFLLTDCVEVARPRKRLADPHLHSVRAALAAIQGTTPPRLSITTTLPSPPTGDAVGDPHKVPPTLDDQSGSSGARMDTGGSGSAEPPATVAGGVSVTRTGSGASGSSLMNIGLADGGKPRQQYKHAELLKLSEVKRVGGEGYVLVDAPAPSPSGWKSASQPP